MNLIVTQPKLLTERFNDDSFCIAFAMKIQYDIGKDFITNIKQGRASFKNCIKTEVIRTFKTYYDRYDLSFSIACTYEKKELFDSGWRWFELNDRFNTYEFPALKIVYRESINPEPNEVIEGLKNVFNSNVLFLNSYSGEPSKEEFRKLLSVNGINVIFASDI